MRADHSPKPLRTASCQAPRAGHCAMLTPRAAVPGERQVSYAHDVPKLCDLIVLLLSLHGENAARRSRLVPKLDRADAAKT